MGRYTLKKGFYLSAFVLNLGGCSGCTNSLMRLFSAGDAGGDLRLERVLWPALADVVLVTGYLTGDNLELVDWLRPLLPENMPVVAVGSCISRGGPYGRSAPPLLGVDHNLPVTVRVENCSPEPRVMMEAISRALGRRSSPEGSGR